MTKIRKFSLDGVGVSTLNPQPVSIGEAARSVDSRLWVHLEVNKVRNETCVPASLISPAHDAEGHQQIPVSAQHARNDCVKWTLAAACLIGMAGDQVEAGWPMSRA